MTKMAKPRGKCETCRRTQACAFLVPTKYQIRLENCENYEVDWSKKKEEKE